MRHQLTDTRIKQRWGRLRSLMGVWQRCGLALEGLGRDILASTLDTGLGYYLGVPANASKLRDAASILNALMAATLVVSRGADLHVMIRRSWLSSVRAVLQDVKEAKCMSASEAIGMLVEADMVDGLDKEISSLIRSSRVASVELLEQAIKCSNKGVGLRDTTLLGLMTNILEAHDQNPDPVIIERQVETTIRNIGIGAVGPRYRYLWRRCVSQKETVSDTADRLLQSVTTSTGMVGPAAWTDASTAMRILQGAHDLKDLRPVIQYCQKLSRVGADRHDLYDALATSVYRRAKETQVLSQDISSGREEHAPQRTPRSDEVKCIDDFLDLTPPPDVRTYTQHRVVELALLVPSSSGYNAARRIYPSVRSERFIWTSARYGEWKSLFHRAIDRRHTQFASRLYTDALADHLVPGRGECLRLIRYTCKAQNASRPILIERLVRDYVAFHAREEDRDMLIVAIAEGLSEGKSEDAALGWTITKRLMVDHSSTVLGRVAPLLMKRLAKVPLQRQRTAMLDILSVVLGNANLYEIAITGLARIATNTDDADLAPNAALSLCTDLYHQLVAQHITPTRKTLSAILVALIKAKRLGTAILVFDKALVNGPVRSDAVGRLMIACALNDQLDKADEVERKWRQSLPQDAYDKGVVGARVLVDTVRGKDVDLRLVRQRTGWQPNAPFLRFLDVIRQQKAEQARTVAQAAGDKAALDPETVFQSSMSSESDQAEENYASDARAVQYA
jgi:hypothetical protein